MVRALLYSDFSPDHINYPNKNGTTAIYWASQENKLDIVTFLLQQQCSGIIYPLLSLHERGDVPLYIASYCGHTDLVRALLDFDSSSSHINLKTFSYQLSRQVWSYVVSCS